MASQFTKIPRAVNELKLFLDYYERDYTDAAKNITRKDGWSIPYYADKIYSIVSNMESYLYYGIHPKLFDDNPVADDEIISDIKSAIVQFSSYPNVFDDIIKKKKKNGKEPILSTVEGIVHDLAIRALLKLKEVDQLATEDLLRNVTAILKTEDIYTIGVVLATTEEFSHFFNAMDNPQPLPTEPDDSQIYHNCTISGKDGTIINVIFTQCHYKGIAPATNTTTKLILRFKPSLIVMLGHAAGNKNLKKSINIGDILICKEAIDYDSAIVLDKTKEGEHELIIKERPNPFKADSTLIQSLRNFALQKSNLKEVKESITNNELFAEDLGYKDGKLISGDALVRSEQWFTNITRDNHEAIGLDMETYGVYYAGENTLKTNKPLFISIKSVSDYGGSNAGLPDEIRDSNVRVDYAIQTSINFFLLYAQNNLPL